MCAHPIIFTFRNRMRRCKRVKHVTCEKPLAMNSQETAALVKLAEKQGRVGAVTYSLRYGVTSDL